MHSTTGLITAESLREMIKKQMERQENKTLESIDAHGRYLDDVIQKNCNSAIRMLDSCIRDYAKQLKYSTTFNVRNGGVFSIFSLKYYPDDTLISYDDKLNAEVVLNRKIASALKEKGYKVKIIVEDDYSETIHINWE